MQEFIQSAINQLGIDESTANRATGSALGFLKNTLGDQFSAIADRLPGAEDLIQSNAEPKSTPEGGLLGSLTDAASSVLVEMPARASSFSAPCRNRVSPSTRELRLSRC